MSKMHSAAAETTEPEKLAPTQSGEIRELKEQLATLVGVVERQSNVALLQAEALCRQDEGIRRFSASYLGDQMAGRVKVHCKMRNLYFALSTGTPMPEYLYPVQQLRG
uniref:Uncharacterized protein n=1 Tax=Ananas comosus var. bracteatus TaxID=296719 RepID=A0A6V7NSD1_ANACO|nr:unnamed protein product [Ananas comosus var. bracteatus]